MRTWGQKMTFFCRTVNSTLFILTIWTIFSRNMGHRPWTVVFSPRPAAVGVHVRSQFGQGVFGDHQQQREVEAALIVVGPSAVRGRRRAPAGIRGRRRRGRGRRGLALQEARPIRRLPPQVQIGR